MWRNAKEHCTLRSLDDPAGLFNASLDGHVRRAIDFRNRNAVDAAGLTPLVRAAVAPNAARGRSK